MAISNIAVNYNSVFANGAVTVAGATWQNDARLSDYFINRLATTSAAPAGEVTIVVNQNTGTYLSANRIIIPALHNLDVALTLEYNSADSWPGTPVTLSPSATPTSGVLFSASFTKVTGAAANRYWRLRFTKTDEALEIPEIWLTEKIELGQSETGSEDGTPDQPLVFPITPNIQIHRSREGVRSAIQVGPSLRGMRLRANAEGGGLSASSYTDYKNLIEQTAEGLRPFFIDDPLGATWFAELVSIQGRELWNPERWNVEFEIAELP